MSQSTCHGKHSTYVRDLIASLVGVTIAILMTRLFDAPAFGWAICAVIMGVSATLTYVPTAKWGLFRLVVAPLLMGAAMWTLVTILPY